MNAVLVLFPETDVINVSECDVQNVLTENFQMYLNDVEIITNQFDFFSKHVYKTVKTNDKTNNADRALYAIYIGDTRPTDHSKVGYEITIRNRGKIIQHQSNLDRSRILFDTCRHDYM